MAPFIYFRKLDTTALKMFPTSGLFLLSKSKGPFVCPADFSAFSFRNRIHKLKICEGVFISKCMIA